MSTYLSSHSVWKRKRNHSNDDEDDDWNARVFTRRDRGIVMSIHWRSIVAILKSAVLRRANIFICFVVVYQRRCRHVLPSMIVVRKENPRLERWRNQLLSSMCCRSSCNPLDVDDHYHPTLSFVGERSLLRVRFPVLSEVLRIAIHLLAVFLCLSSSISLSLSVAYTCANWSFG